MTSNLSVACILILYNPDLIKFMPVIDSIKNQAGNIFLIDNSEHESRFDFSKYPNIKYIFLNRNTGIATAQNIGIREAQKIKSQYIWLSDQDTIYPENYLEIMVNIFKKNNTMNICSAAPAYFDTNKNALQPFTLHQPFTKYFAPHTGVNLLSHSIASGMIIPTSILEIVGLMQDDLFIDTVDLEWCWRAKNIYGYQNVGNGDVVIKHTLGDGYVNFCRRKISIHAPIRHYYMIRNAIHLSLYSKSTTKPMKIEIMVKALAWMFLFPLLAPQSKINHLKATTLGFIHGMANRLGPLNHKL